MKKLMTAALFALAGIVAAEAQTEFRHISFNDALTAAKKEKKLVFVDFYTTWCGPCKKMAKTVFPMEEVGAYMNKTFVPLKLDAENEAPDLAKKFGVNAYPTYIIFDGDGKEVTRFSGSMEGPEFIEKLKCAIDPDLQPGRLKARYESGERTPSLVNAFAMQVIEGKDEEGGLKIIDDYFASLSDKERLKAENSFLFTRYTLSLDDPKGEFLYNNIDKFPSSTKEEMKRYLKQLLHNQLSMYFSGYMFREGKFDAAEFAKLKERIKAQGVNKGNSYDLMIEFAEKRPKMNDAEYLALCRKHYSEFDDIAKNLLVMNIARLVKTDTPELKKGVSQFLREQLPTMSPSAIQFAGRVLGSVEQGM